MANHKSVKDLIYKAYIRAALLPILVIEVTLLVMYFGITSYIEKATEHVLLNEATVNIAETASKESKNINQQIDEISRLAVLVQKENQRLFAVPEAFGLPNGKTEFSFAGDGTYYKSKDNGGSSLWYSGITKVGDAEKRKALFTEAMDPIFKDAFEANPNNVAIYFNSYDSMNRYYPFIPDVYTVFEPKMDIPRFNFYYLADLAHNPQKTAVWTDVYLDPAGKGWMASCVVPIYNPKGFLEGVTGFDVTIDRFLTNILNLQLPWKASAFLIDKNGVILAMPSSIESVLGFKELRNQVYAGKVKQDTLKPEEFNLLKSKDPEIARQMSAVFNNGKAVNEFVIKGKPYMLTQSEIKQTGWRLMILVDQSIVFEPATKLQQLSQKVGIMAFVLMVVFYLIFFTFLMFKSKMTAGKIANPIKDMAEKTTQIRDNLLDVNLDQMQVEVAKRDDVEEVVLLNDNFMSMAKELQRFYLELDDKVRQRTEELESTNMELQNVNLQLIQQEKMASIGQLAAGIAHEINNPMGFVISNINVMSGYLEQILKYLKAVEDTERDLQQQLAHHPNDLEAKSILSNLKELREELKIGFIVGEIPDLIEEALDGTGRVKNIVQELRTFSRIAAETDFADINRGLESVINIIWNELKYKVELQRDYGNLPEIRCNMGQLNQVFMNLLLNAVQSIETKGEIQISTKVVEDDIVVVISDTGTGIPENIQNRIFDPFFTTKEVGSGTGLGLSISYEIIRKHKGHIRLESEVGKGTTFTITIPIVTN